MKKDFKPNTTEYKNEHARLKYDRLNIMIPKGEKERIQLFIKGKYRSLNDFVIKAINEKIEREE